MLQDHSKRPPQQHDVQPHAPVADVPRIHLDPFVVGGVAAAVHLPHAGDAGMDHVEIFDIWAVFGDFSSDDGPGAHQAHLTDEYIEQLGQFVQAGLPQHPSYSCDPGILFQLEFSFPLFPGFRIVFQVFFQPLVCIHTHGPELQAGEQFPILADPLVSENDRARGIQLDQEGQQQEDRNQKDTADNGEYQIKDPFDEPVVRTGQIVLQAHEHEPFIEQGFYFDAVHRQTDQIRHERKVPHMGLDGMDQLVQVFQRKTRSGDADILDLGLFDDIHCLAEGAQVRQISHICFLWAGIIHVADDVEVEADIIPDALEHQTGGLPGPHQEHWDASHSCPVQEMGKKVTGQRH